MEIFKQKLHDVNWNDIRTFDNINDAYNRFLEISLYDQCFPKQKNPCITKGIERSSKKNKDYEKFLKNRTIKKEKLYKRYKNLFESKTIALRKTIIPKTLVGYKIIFPAQENILVKSFIPKPCQPPKSFVFLKTKIGERNYPCQYQWFELFP